MAARQATPAATLTVYLNKAGNSEAPVLPASGAYEESPLKASSVYSSERTSVAQRPIDVSAILPIPRPVEIRYFQLNELTQEPLVAQGLAGDRILVVPGITSQVATVRLWINGQGGIDRVAVEDSRLSGEEERAMTEAFANVKFHPGMIGRIPVRSQITKEIMLENALQL